MAQFLRRLTGRAIVLVLMFSIAPSWAAPAGPEVLAAGQILRGRFVQDRALSGFAKPLRSEGNFVLVPGEGLIWRVEKPFSNTTIITSAGIVQMVNGNEAMRLAASRLPGLSHFYEVLGAAVSGDLSPLRQTFAVTTADADAGWRVVLKPLHLENPAMSQFKSLTLGGSRFVDSVVVEKNGGDVDRISFSDHKVSKADLSADEKALLRAVKR